MELQNFAQDWISNFGVYNRIVDLIWKSDYTWIRCALFELYLSRILFKVYRIVNQTIYKSVWRVSLSSCARTEQTGKCVDARWWWTSTACRLTVRNNEIFTVAYRDNRIVHGYWLKYYDR